MDGTIITKRGMQLLVKLMATKGVLTFTRVAIGTGSIPNGYDPASMIELVQYKMDGVISKCSAEEDVARITMQVSSVGIETGFIMTEMGVFASDPDIGEILYAYLDMKDDPQYIYAEGGETQKFVETTLEVAIEHATKVSTYINPSSLITKEDFDTEIEKITEPEFDDSGEVTGITSFPTFLEKVKSKMNFFDFFKNLKAGLKFVLHTGQIVNNCVSDNAELPLSAMQGKVLMDLINQTNGNLTNTIKSPGSLTLGADLDNLSVGIYQITGVKINVSGTTVAVWGTIIVCRRAFDYQQVILSNGTKAIYYRSKNESEAWTGWKQLVTNENLPIYGTLNGVTKIKNLPFGIYNLASADMRRLTDTPHELNGRSIIITTGDSTNDEKVALILSSHIGYGGVYFGYIWGGSVPEFSWKKIVENSN